MWVGLWAVRSACSVGGKRRPAHVLVTAEVDARASQQICAQQVGGRHRRLRESLVRAPRAVAGQGGCAHRSSPERRCPRRGRI